MKRCLIIALVWPALLLAGCDSLSRFARVQPNPTTGDSEPTREALAVASEAGVDSVATRDTQQSDPLIVRPATNTEAGALANAPAGERAGSIAGSTSGRPADPLAGQASSSATARLSDREPAASPSPDPAQPPGIDAQPPASPAQPPASPAQPPASPAQPPASDVQLASAMGLSSAARRTFDAMLASLPNPAASENEKLAREIAAFRPFPFEFTLPTLAGDSFDSRQTQHQLIVVDIWATWCGPCRKAIPDFVAIQDSFASRGVQVVGITCDSADPANAAEIRRKASEIGEQLNVNYPLLIDDGTTTAQVPGFRGYPTTLFLTPSGQVLYKVTGMQSEAQLAAILNHLLPTP